MLQLDVEERVGKFIREDELRKHAREDAAYAASVQAAQRATR